MQARITEDQRYALAGGKGPDGRALSRRPDTVARKWMEEDGQTINTEPCAGHVPGIAVGDRYSSSVHPVLMPKVVQVFGSDL